MRITFVLLRFLSGKGEIEKVEEILYNTMKLDGVKPDLTCLAQLVYCYVKVGQTQKAEEMVQRMIDKRTADNDNDDKSDWGKRSEYHDCLSRGYYVGFILRQKEKAISRLR
jgi:pentatricopeptide repeat protein